MQEQSCLQGQDTWGSPCKHPVGPRLLLWGTLLALGGTCPTAAGTCSVLPNVPSSDTSVLAPVHVFFQSLLPSLELRTRTISPGSKEEPPAQELLGASSSALCLPTASLPRGLPHLSQPPPCSGYFPYYRTEGGICTGPLQREGSFTRVEGLETRERGQRRGSGVWNLRESCLVSWEERRGFVNADVKEKLLNPKTTWKSAWIWIKWKYSFSQKPPSDIPDCLMEAEISRVGAWEIQ